MIDDDDDDYYCSHRANLFEWNVLSVESQVILG